MQGPTITDQWRTRRPPSGLPGPGSVFLHVDWSFRAPVRPDDVLTAEAEVLEVRDDKPITRLATGVVRQDGVEAVDGTALVWRDPVVALASDRTWG